jgi:hypothetical protein
MSSANRLALPLLVLVIAVAYWLLSHEPAGTVLLFLFSVALGVMIWVLGGTVNDVGPTAPVDPDWNEPEA